jgi:hypothetical protein
VILRLLLLVALAATGCVSHAGALTRDVLRVPASSYQDELVQRARALGLARTLTWRRLGHYRETLGGGWGSEADGPNFFLAANGKENPTAELEATIRGFFADEPPASSDQAVQHPICQFPARFAWLKAALSIDERLRVPACPRYQEFVARLNPRSARLVFSAYYLNAPASVFGHTFLRIDGNAERLGVAGRTTKKQELLDYGIDFSAEVDTSNSLLYAVKGLLGMFPGKFRLMPYYYKVREYNDFESRDLWEYELALSKAELDQLVAHLWELGSTWFDYYYVSENCSYHILGALEGAVPRLSLLREIHTPAVPADTVKALYAQPGLVKSVAFRPSLRASFRARLIGLPGQDEALVEALAASPETPLPPLAAERRIAVLDAAQDLVDVQGAKEIVGEPDGPAARKKQRLLERRAEILAPSADLVVQTPWGKQPQLGHDSRRAGAFGGVDIDGRPFVQLEYRLTLHDLVDPADGYPDLAQLEWLPTRLRVRRDDDGSARLVVDHVSFLRLASMTAQDRFDRHMSWKLDVGATRYADAGCEGGDGCTAGKLQVGGGVAFGTSWLTVFATADSLVAAGPELDGLRGSPWRLGIGPAGGLRLRFTPRLAWLFTGEWIWLPGQEPLAAWRGESNLRWGVGKDLAVDATAWISEDDAWARLGLFLYF